MSFVKNTRQETDSISESRKKRKSSPSYTIQEDQVLVSTTQTSIKKQRTSLPVIRITFLESDPLRKNQHFDDLMVVTIVIGKTQVRRVLIDQGSFVNILFQEVLKSNERI